jgi:hypothetical protein
VARAMMGNDLDGPRPRCSTIPNTVSSTSIPTRVSLYPLLLVITSISSVCTTKGRQCLGTGPKWY